MTLTCPGYSLGGESSKPAQWQPTHWASPLRAGLTVLFPVALLTVGGLTQLPLPALLLQPLPLLLHPPLLFQPAVLLLLLQG